MEDFRAALAKPGLMVIDAFAVWCGPCKVIAPKFVELSKKYADARFYKLDIDEVPDVAHELSIRIMPTFKLFKDGEEYESVIGINLPGLNKAIASGLGLNTAGPVEAEAKEAEKESPKLQQDAEKVAQEPAKVEQQQESPKVELESQPKVEATNGEPKV